ncbi:MAG: AI-2E family transporter [Patescibacteria group bacterium]
MQFAYIQQFFFFGLLAATTLLFFYMLGGFLTTVLWAVIIALVFHPVYRYLQVKYKGRDSLASVSTVMLVVLVVLVPLISIGSMVVSESLSLYETLTQEDGDFDSSGFLARVSIVTSYLEPYGISQANVENRLRDWAASVSQVVASSLVSFSQNTITFLIQVVVMLYLLFFFLRDGKTIERLIRHHLPLGDDYERQLFSRFSETTQAVIKGTLLISVVQGIIGGVLFWIVGIPNPVLWGVTMAVLAIIPLLGTAVVWLPAAIILMVTGSVLPGVIIILVGAIIISSIDNFLRPILVGRSTKMPDALVLLSTIGGLATFGVSGFIIGPIIAAFFLSLWTIFEEKYHVQLTKNY